MTGCRVGLLRGTALIGAVCVMLAGCSGRVENTSSESGEALFLRLCSGCHPGGRNVKYPAKSLDRMTLAANGITDEGGIVRVLRSPGPGMPQFDRSRLTDRDAAAVARYVLTTFR